MAQTAGVKPFPIAGRVASERERCIGMTQIEREWRKQWLKDQILSPNEPAYVEEYWRERTNPIRRIYRLPLDVTFGVLSNVLGENRAADYRYIAGKLGLITIGILCTHYYFKYSGNDWTKKGGFRVVKSKPLILPGQEGFPFITNRKMDDYAERGFKSSVLYAK
ncbi:NADH dehydrogenase [ubiquinone] 1 beta subcomplex subunit 6-like [Pieris rapae]|uniref:NADH dehydrogenase [ubiquinone] 1 beta subcomplex subunit 6-like n=1 Tax=Pieris rapae TaxID=64459 RepID=UPI001E27E264|nr:NADH dehydrogenase [ubiquinone] 1 beta subcomplex subunit 6-like [Pieris rapae]